jgi:hypothetical protein
MKFSEKNNSRTCKHTKSIAVSFSHEITKELTVQCRGHSGTVWWFFYEKELIEEKSNEKKWYVFVTKKLIDGKSNWKVIFSNEKNLQMGPSSTRLSNAQAPVVPSVAHN